MTKAERAEVMRAAGRLAKIQTELDELKSYLIGVCKYECTALQAAKILLRKEDDA